MKKYEVFHYEDISVREKKKNQIRKYQLKEIGNMRLEELSGHVPHLPERIDSFIERNPDELFMMIPKTGNLFILVKTIFGLPNKELSKILSVPETNIARWIRDIGYIEYSNKSQMNLISMIGTQRYFDLLTLTNIGFKSIYSLILNGRIEDPYDYAFLLVHKHYSMNDSLYTGYTLNDMLRDIIVVNIEMDNKRLRNIITDDEIRIGVPSLNIINHIIYSIMEHSKKEVREIIDQSLSYTLDYSMNEYDSGNMKFSPLTIADFISLSYEPQELKGDINYSLENEYIGTVRMLYVLLANQGVSGLLSTYKVLVNICLLNKADDRYTLEIKK